MPHVPMTRSPGRPFEDPSADSRRRSQPAGDRLYRCGPDEPPSSFVRPRPACRARMMACARSATRSLAKMFVTLLRMVLSDSVSRRAISRLPSPAAIKSRISLFPGSTVLTRPGTAGLPAADGRVQSPCAPVPGCRW